MPRDPVTHLHASDGKTRCGRRLARVKWSADAADVDCNNCRRLIELDANTITSTATVVTGWEDLTDRTSVFGYVTEGNADA